MYIYSDFISLILNNDLRFPVSVDGWGILKCCNGVRDEDCIYKEVTKEYQISREEFDDFIKLAKEKGIIELIEKEKLINCEFFNYNDISSIRSASVELTDKCNLRCIYCYGEYEPIKCDALKINEMTYIFDKLYDLGVSVVELTGGEPLSHPNFKEILLLAVNTFENVNILSNGVLFDEEVKQNTHFALLS